MRTAAPRKKYEKENPMLKYVLLIAGFMLLIKGADFFVSGSSSIAYILKVPSVVIGLTIVAMGTSAPEAAVSITAGLSGNNDISLGNIIGSNIFNLLMVIGISAMIQPVKSQKEIIRRDMWWNIGVSAVLFLLILDQQISRMEGVLLLSGMILYLIFVIRSALKNRTDGEAVNHLSIPKSICFIVFGLAAIIAGGNLVVDNASLIARAWGMSDTLVGLTIVAIGTSLPELVTSIVAAKKGDSGIALGNAVGSCLFNIMFILGMTSLLSPIHATTELMIDSGILIAVSALIFLFAFSKEETNRWEGLLCLLCYIAYSIYIILR